MTKTEGPPPSGSTKMRARARIISLIGEELISDEPVALVELVKNSFDADAKQVLVRFDETEVGQVSRLTVSDDGVGMDLETVLGAWLEPGTILKKKRDRSPGGRPYLGAKGIGRFAAARLRDTLLLHTHRAGTDKAVVVLLNWGSFTDDQYLEDIEIEYDTKPDPKGAAGTTLTIEGLKPALWDNDSFTRLHSRLSRLISPFDEVKDFEIKLEIPSHLELSGPVRAPDLVLRPKYQMTGRLDESGTFTGTVSIDGKEQPIARFLGHNKDERPNCGPFDVEIRAWDRDREGLAPIAEREGRAISQIRQTLNHYSGVSIYRDGFRVHP